MKTLLITLMFASNLAVAVSLDIPISAPVSSVPDVGCGYCDDYESVTNSIMDKYQEDAKKIESYAAEDRRKWDKERARNTKILNACYDKMKVEMDKLGKMEKESEYKKYLELKHMCDHIDYNESQSK